MEKNIRTELSTENQQSERSNVTKGIYLDSALHDNNLRAALWRREIFRRGVQCRYGIPNHRVANTGHANGAELRELLHQTISMASFRHYAH